MLTDLWSFDSSYTTSISPSVMTPGQVPHPTLLEEGPLLTDLRSFDSSYTTSIALSVMTPGQVPHPKLPVMSPVQDPHPFAPANRQRIMTPGQVPHPKLPVMSPVQDPDLFSPANRQNIMAPGQTPHSNWQNIHQSYIAPVQLPLPYAQANPQPIMVPAEIPDPRWPPYGFHENWQRSIWVIRIQDTFQKVIRYAESQPSNGTVRTVERPDDVTRFMVAYSFAPDQELENLFVRLPAGFELLHTDFVFLAQNLH